MWHVPSSIGSEDRLLEAKSSTYMPEGERVCLCVCVCVCE